MSRNRNAADFPLQLPVARSASSIGDAPRGTSIIIRLMTSIVELLSRYEAQCRTPV